MRGEVTMTDREDYKLSKTENLEIRNQKPFEIEFKGAVLTGPALSEFLSLHKGEVLK